MPKTPPKRPTSHRAAPYSSPGSNSGDDQKPTVAGSPGGPKGRGSTWTADELKTLFRFAMNKGTRGWGEAVPGRSTNQAYQTWSKTILPYIDKCLEDRAKT